MNSNNYSLLAKIFHWGFVILFVYGVAKQVEDIAQLEDKIFFAFEIIFAILFFSLLVIRFIYMQKTQKTSLPNDTPKVQKIAAKFVHFGMYSLLGIIVTSGLFIGYLYSLEIVEGIIMNLTIRIHEIAVNLLYLFIGVHILAALFHRFKKDGVWDSMVPFLKEKSK